MSTRDQAVSPRPCIVGGAVPLTGGRRVPPVTPQPVPTRRGRSEGSYPLPGEPMGSARRQLNGWAQFMEQRSMEQRAATKIGSFPLGECDLRGMFEANKN